VRPLSRPRWPIGSHSSRHAADGTKPTSHFLQIIFIIITYIGMDRAGHQGSPIIDGSNTRSAPQSGQELCANLEIANSHLYTIGWHYATPPQKSYCTVHEPTGVYTTTRPGGQNQKFSFFQKETNNKQNQTTVQCRIQDGRYIQRCTSLDGPTP